MSSITEYIESGILEMYVLGITSPQETEEVEKMAISYPEIKQEIELLRKNIEVYSEAYALNPPATVKPFLMAMIDYSERMKSGEAMSFPPVLNEQTTIKDYSEWIDRPDMILPDSFDGLFAKIIGYSTEMTTAIAWIKEMAPQEIHHDEHEKFFILEGSCDIIVGDKTNHLKAGDYFSIPLHQNHFVKVTSEIPCKVILQRIAA